MSSSASVQWGIGIPQHFFKGPVDVSLIQRFAVRAEAIGYHSLWVQDRAASADFPILEPVSLLCYAAAFTTRIRLGSSVIIAPVRDAPQLARSLANIDQLSGGRLTVGVGLGNDGDYAPYGLSTKRRVQRLVEALEVLKALWTQPSVTHEGEFWQLNNLSMEPKPVQQPHPPIWFGGRQPSALKRAVRHGDGWMGAGMASTADFKKSVPLLRGYLEEEQRDPATFPISKRVYIAVDRDRARAEQRLREFFDSVYSNADRGPTVSVWGAPEECVQQLGEVLSMTPQLVLLNVVSDYMEQMETLAKEVIPKLQ